MHDPAKCIRAPVRVLVGALAACAAPTAWGDCLAQRTTLEDVGNVNASSATALARRADGRPLVAYTDNTRGKVRIYDCADAICTSGNAHDAPDANALIGQSLSMIMRGNGTALLSYFDDVANDLRILDCADASCVAGTARVADGDGDAGFFSDIARRSDGSAQIAYARELAAQAWLYSCGDSSCSSGTRRLIDDRPGSVGSNIALAMRDGDLAALSYHDSTGNGGIRITSCADSACTITSQRTLDTGFLFSDTDIAVRSDGRAMVAYVGVAGSSRIPRLHVCADAACTNGVTRNLGQVPVQGLLSVALGIAADGRASMAYQQLGTGDLMLYACADAECTSGSTDTVDSNGDAGYAISMDMSTGWPPVLAYFEAGGDIRVAACVADTVLSDGFE
jgi:hypothetical protein